MLLSWAPTCGTAEQITAEMQYMPGSSPHTRACQQINVIDSRFEKYAELTYNRHPLSHKGVWNCFLKNMRRSHYKLHTLLKQFVFLKKINK